MWPFLKLFLNINIKFQVRRSEVGFISKKQLKGLAMIFSGQENPFIISEARKDKFKSKEIQNPLKLLKLHRIMGFW